MMVYMCVYNKFFLPRYNFTDSTFSFIFILKYLSIYPSLTFLIFIQVFRAGDSRRDSDGCYCVWSAPAWLMDWSVNGNDSTEFYAVSRTKKTVIRSAELTMETMRLSRCRLWKMKNRRLVRFIQNCFSAIRSKISRKWKLLRGASYQYLIYITCLKYAFLFNIHIYSASENLFHAVHKARAYKRCTKGIKRNGKTIKLCPTNHSSAHRRRTVIIIISCTDDAR